MGLFPENWDLTKEEQKLVKSDKEEICNKCFQIKAKNGTCGCDV